MADGLRGGRFRPPVLQVEPLLPRLVVDRVQAITLAVTYPASAASDMAVLPDNTYSTSTTQRLHRQRHRKLSPPARCR